MNNITRLAILGSTGSIGRQTLEIVRSMPGRFQVVALAAGRNTAVLLDQVREFRPQYFSSVDPSVAAAIDGWATTEGARPVALPIEEMARHPDVDIVVMATVGLVGLRPTLAALEAGKVVALANKEVLVVAGNVVTKTARQFGGELRPVDSEHSAIWQCLWGEHPSSIRRIILTASGGALRDFSGDELRAITPEQALRHPTWQMGQKVTIDSASLLNKGFEAIEARWFFDVPMERIGAVLHRESIVHSLVEFTDGSLKAQIGHPDMRLPIQCALSYPERLPVAGSQPFDLASLGSLTFAPIDLDRFPCLRLALEAARLGGTYPAVLSAVDEVAVEEFLVGHIGFLQIPQMLEGALAAHTPVEDPTFEAILEADAWARAWAQEWVKATA
jgi:1-deoxy-D-xylulose-5-phosphate reductoisomerase